MASLGTKKRPRWDARWELGGNLANERNISLPNLLK